MSKTMTTYRLTTNDGTQFNGRSITECVERWNRRKPYFADYGDAMIASIEPITTDIELPPPEQRGHGWPKLCQASWADSFRNWAGQKQPKMLTAATLEAVAHTLTCNLALILELEEQNKLLEADTIVEGVKIESK